ncbi:MAG: MarR family winged helix-turn-helix transcriptional regulator [Opitutaceae bacterium]
MNKASASYPQQARTLGSLLQAPYRALRRRVYGRLAERGFPEIRPAHSAVLRHILPEGSRPTELAAAAGLTKQSMAYLVEHLTTAGVVRTVPDPEDGRARLVQLTARGRKLMDALVAASAEAEQEVVAVLGREAVDTLRTQLTALGAALAGADVPET